MKNSPEKNVYLKEWRIKNMEYRKEYDRNSKRKFRKENPGYNPDSRRTIRQYPRNLYRQILKRIKYRPSYRNRELTFSLDQFLDFISKSNFEQLYREWKDSGFDTKLSPSVDRIDNSRGYHLDNIQIIPHSENSKKGDK